jgi:hypothetical protein
MTRLRGSRHDDGKASRGLKIKKEILKQNQSSNFFSILILNGFGHTSVSQGTNGLNTRKRKTFTENGVVPWVRDLSFRTLTIADSSAHRPFFTPIHTQRQNTVPGD